MNSTNMATGNISQSRALRIRHWRETLMNLGMVAGVMAMFLQAVLPLVHPLFEGTLTGIAASHVSHDVSTVVTLSNAPVQIGNAVSQPLHDPDHCPICQAIHAMNPSHTNTSSITAVSTPALIGRVTPLCLADVLSRTIEEFGPRGPPSIG